MFQLKKKLLPLAAVNCFLKKKWKKLIPNRQKFSYIMVKIWSFLKNWLSLIAVTVSTERKNLGTKEISFD